MMKGNELTRKQAPTRSRRHSAEAGFCCGNSLFCGLFLIAFGAFFLVDSLDLFPWSFYFWRYWPVLLIALGGWMLWKRTAGEPANHQRGELG